MKQTCKAWGGSEKNSVDSPFTSKGSIGRAELQLPLTALPDFIGALKKLHEKNTQLLRRQ